MDTLIHFIQDYGTFVMPVICVFIIILVIVLFTYYSSKNSIIRAFKKSRKKPIHRIKNDEYAKIIGHAKPLKTPLIAPLSQRECVYYQIIVEIKGDKHWRRIITDTSLQDFLIETQSEFALVKPTPIKNKTCVSYLVKDYTKNSGFRHDATPELEAYLKKHNKGSVSIIGLNKTLRYTEAIIELNEKIGVKGIAKWDTIKEPIEGYSYSKILTLEGTKDKKLLITDEPKALIPVQKKL